MIDRDFSFLRLRTTLADALNLNESKGVDLEYVGNIHLIPGETYLQITNSTTDIAFSSNYEVYLVDHCGNEIVDVTLNVYIEEFYDLNGIKQIAWEFINQFDYYYKPLSLRFRNTVNDNTWYTNLFISTAMESEMTTRFDYSCVGGTYHDGTYYPKITRYQSIRLACWYDDDVNQSERSEYHQVSTDVTMSARNIKKIKEKYMLEEFSTFHTRRLESLLTSDYVYVDTVRAFSSDPIEFPEREGDSNIGYGDFLISKDYTQIYTFAYQIFEGFNVVSYYPDSVYTVSSLGDKGKITFNVPISIGEGTITVYDASDDSVVMSVTQDDLSISTTYSLTWDGLNTFVTTNGNYYVQYSAGIATFLNLSSEAVTDKTTWTFTISDADFDADDFDGDDFFTGES